VARASWECNQRHWRHPVAGQYPCASRRRGSRNLPLAKNWGSTGPAARGTSRDDAARPGWRGTALLQYASTVTSVFKEGSKEACMYVVRK